MDAKKNIHKFPGVLLQGVSQEASKLLYEKVEIVAEGTKAKMAELEASNKQLREMVCEFAHYLACPAYVLRPGTTKTIIDIAAEGRAEK